MLVDFLEITGNPTNTLRRIDFPLITTMLAETEILIVRIRTHWTSDGGREGRSLKRGLDFMMPYEYCTKSKVLVYSE